jgi:ABC-2 type transport system permease protein
MRLLRANLRKLVRRPATWVTFLLLVALVGLLYLALIASSQQAENPQAKLAAQLVVTFPGAYANAASLVLGLGGILALTYGAAIAGSEWPWGTLKAAIARGESRSRYTLVGYLGVLVAVVIGFLAAYALALVGAAIGSAILGVPLDGAGQQSAILTLPELIGRGSLALSMEAAIGFAIATVARSQLAGIGVGIGLLVVQNIAGIFLPNVFKWFPFSAASAVIADTSAGGGGGGGGGGPAVSLGPDVAVVVVALWLIGALVLAALWTERAEIAG